MADKNFVFKKSLGQNFLQDPNTINKIVACIDPGDQDNILEIGPGAGALTSKLVNRCLHLWAVEVDQRLVTYLSEHIIEENFELIRHDILSFNWHNIDSHKLKIVGNLPYNISSQIIFQVVKNYDRIQNCTFMLQQELVDRICATSGNKIYGRLSVMCQYYFKCKKALTISKNCFYPVPKVSSAIVQLLPTYEHGKVKDEALFSELVKAAFGMRRKTIGKSLAKYYTKAELHEHNFNPMSRAEDLSVTDYVRLTNIIT